MLAAFSAKSELTADWKIHMPFDDWPVQVVETPNKVYFLNRTFEFNQSLAERAVASHALFCYDKAGDEVTSLNKRNIASGNAVTCIGYNASKKYLLVVYTDLNIDFIYDDGRVYNLSALVSTSIPGKKEVNSITFDNAKNRVYLATTFGYLALNDEKHEVAESRNYGENIATIARCGSNIVLSADNMIFYAPAHEQRFNISDYKVYRSAPEIGMIVPLENDNFIGYKTSPGVCYVYTFQKTNEGFKYEQFAEDPQIFGVQQVPSGHRITGNVRLYHVSPSGEITTFNRPEEEWRKPAASYDGNQLWVLTSRKGLRNYKKNGDQWTLAKDYIHPNSPATYLSTAISYHPKFGILAGSNGADYAYSEFNQATPSNVSALKDGFWKEYGYFYTNPTALTRNTNFFGMAIDPKNNNYVYRSNTLGGLMRMNLADPNDILILANPSSRNAGSKGFVKVVEDLKIWNVLCRFSTPQFTPDGTMWTMYNNADYDRNEIWYWTAADRAATTSAATYRPMKKFNLPEFPNGNGDVMITLSKNPNMVAIASGDNGHFMIYDHRGTPDVTNDDRYVFMESGYDQDGGGVIFLRVHNLREDPETGLIWVMSERGLFTVNPVSFFENPNVVNRIKVSRNDGTNLADYLLNEINVNDMSIDGEKRKWFSTSNGLVCTSADGKTILGEFTVDNSYLPSNNVFTCCYNPDNNSMLVATEGGLVEMFPSGSGGAGATEDSGVRAYPNPVEPDYYGWVRIDNIADGSLVKITDSRGGLVKELGPAQGGSVEWDVSGLNNTRVSTGVYYIMVSPGSAGNGKTQVSKILILN